MNGIQRYSTPHPFQPGAVRFAGNGSIYRLCAHCTGTEDCRLGSHAGPRVHVPALSPFVRRALANELPAKAVTVR